MSKMTEEQLFRQRQRRKADGNAATHKYEKTKSGFLMRAYRNMKSRVTGIQRKKAHLYKGLYLLPRQDFYTLSLADNNFHKLFEQWVKSDYNRKLTPSVDRIDPSKGYEPNNIRWLEHMENSRLGAESKWRNR